MSASCEVKHLPGSWHILLHMWPQGSSSPQGLPQSTSPSLQSMFVFSSLPHLQRRCTGWRHGGQGPVWQVRGQGWPQGRLTWQGSLQSGYSPQATGGWRTVFPQVQATGLIETHLQGLQKPLWQNSVHLCTPQSSSLSHIMVQKCRFCGSPAGPNSLFAVQHIY